MKDGKEARTAVAPVEVERLVMRMLSWQKARVENLIPMSHAERMWIDDAEDAMRRGVEDDDKWLKEVLTDFRIDFDDHPQGRRLALIEWMNDHAR